MRDPTRRPFVPQKPAKRACRISMLTKKPGTELSARVFALKKMGMVEAFEQETFDVYDRLFGTSAPAVLPQTTEWCRPQQRARLFFRQRMTQSLPITGEPTYSIWILEVPISETTRAPS